MTFDRWQSMDSIQQLRRSGINVDTFSVDSTPAAYNVWCDAHYAGEIDMPAIRGYIDNVRSLTLTSTGKIDHRMGGKDITDAVAGCVYHCRMRGMKGDITIRRVDMLPISLSDKEPNDDPRNAKWKIGMLKDLLFKVQNREKIICTLEEYPEIRNALIKYVNRKLDIISIEDSEYASSEMIRLDKLFKWNKGNINV